MKISEKIKEYKEHKKVFYSFEFFPPKTDYGMDNLYSRIDRMASYGPAYIDITWGAGGSTADRTLDMSKTIQKYFGLDVMMHLTCTNMSIDLINNVLSEAKENNISNILALRGDPPEGNHEWQKDSQAFNYGADLVHYIRKNYGSTFFLAAGGYPETHQEQTDPDLDIKYLKEKVDAGVDIIVTQLFYDIDKFLIFRDKCVSKGIDIPIIPGIMPIHNYARFRKFTQFCNVNIPNNILKKIEPIKNDDASVIKFGVDQGAEMCENLIKEGVPGLHFYTLNLEHSVKEILYSIGLTSDKKTKRDLPWRQSSDQNRKSSEDVRPIFWSNRPISYLTRTENWDDFPNGRWGDISSPTFGELNQYHAIRAGSKSNEIRRKRKKIWGEPKSIKDVSNVFVSFCKGDINSLPWCETKLAIESKEISSELVKLNKAGYFTINSQPNLNGVSSSDSDFGWGAEDGIVYQKAYLEFFTSKENLNLILDKIKRNNTISYQAVNKSEDLISNVKQHDVNVVTWGVFPGQKIKQPTIVDARSFMIWKDEAFSIWMNDWAAIYEKKSISYSVLKKIYENYYLVNIVDNDFINSKMIKDILDK